MLLEFFLVLIRADQISEQNSCMERKVSFKIFRVCLKLCSFFDFEFMKKILGMFKATQFLRFRVYQKNITTVLPRTHPGGNRNLNRTLAFNKKFSLKFFGFVKSSSVSSISSLSKNFTGLFCRTHLGGNRTLNRTVGFKKKNPSEIFCVCLKYCSFLDFEFIEKYYYSFS